MIPKRAGITYSIITMKLLLIMTLVLCCVTGLGATLDATASQPEVVCANVIPSQQKSTSPELPAVELTVVASDISLSHEQWHLSRVMAPQAWQITSGKSDILIAVLDTGIDQTHKELANKVVASINLTQSPTADDLYGHGTHIAGVIAAIADNTVGTTGLAYNCSLMNVKVAEDDGSCDPATVDRGIIWAADNGAKVINISLTINEPSTVLEGAVDYAWARGAIVIAAAGNNYGSEPVYPAAYPNAIAVAATDKDDRLARWSNYSDWISVGAPGVDIYSILPHDNYGSKSGTSLAAAVVSGEAALLFTIAVDTNGNGYFNDEVRHIIESNCDEVETEGLGAGRINALKAATAMYLASGSQP